LMKLTLDTNCIIDLEKNGPDAVFLNQLVEPNNKDKVRLGVAAISGAEKQLGGRYLDNFLEFKNLLKILHLEDADILKPIAEADLAFADFCVVPDEDMVELERRIHQVLFPMVEFDYQAYRARRNLAPDSLDTSWRNHRCDVLAMWCHIQYKRDIFVTRDRNFHKQSKKSQLVHLGAKEILAPYEIAARVPLGARPLPKGPWPELG